MNLSTLVHEPRLKCPKLEKLTTELNEQIAALTKKHQEHASELGLLKGTARHLLSVKQLARAPQMKLNAIELMREEYRLRHRVKEEWFPALNEARMEASQKAFENIEKLKSDLKSKLIEIGYIDGKLPGNGFDSITPDHFLRHPDVHAAQCEYQSAQNLVHDSSARQHNDEGLNRLGEEIDEAVDRITSAL